MSSPSGLVVGGLGRRSGSPVSRSSNVGIYRVGGTTLVVVTEYSDGLDKPRISSTDDRYSLGVLFRRVLNRPSSFPFLTIAL